MKSPPILLYHKITPGWDVSVALTSPKVFERQMRGLFRAGWRGVALDRWGGGEKEFVLAFDDGYECVDKYGFKIASELGFTATVFIPTGFIGRTNDWDHQVYGLKFRHLDIGGLKRLADAGWEIGSHTVNHLSLQDLSVSRVRLELSESKSRLEEITGRKITSVSFPFGRYNKSTLDLAAQAGYRRGMAPGLISGDAITTGEFQLFGAEAVYLWDGWSSLEGRLNHRGKSYRIGSNFRRIVNKFAAGTVIYQRLASKDYKDLPKEGS